MKSMEKSLLKIILPMQCNDSKTLRNSLNHYKPPRFILLFTPLVALLLRMFTQIIINK